MPAQSGPTLCPSSPPVKQVSRQLPSQQLLHDDRIHPVSIQEPHLFVNTHRGKSLPCIEAHASRISRESREDDFMIAELAGQWDEWCQQTCAQPLATPGSRQIDGQVSDVLVGRPDVKRVERGPPGNTATGFCYQDWMAWTVP